MALVRQLSQLEVHCFGSALAVQLDLENAAYKVSDSRKIDRFARLFEVLLVRIASAGIGSDQFSACMTPITGVIALA